MANPMLGILMIILVMVGLVCSDGFLGFSYLASLAVRGVMPHNLHDEAFSALHKKMGLPSYGSVLQTEMPSGEPVNNHKMKRTGRRRAKHHEPSENADEEIVALIESKKETAFSHKP